MIRFLRSILLVIRGGLAVFWKKSVNIKFQTVNKNLLDCLIQLDSVSFYASCVYGPSDWSSRCELWERLSRIGVNRKDGWCVFGDFNDILHNGEKVGGTWRADESFEPYNQIIKAEKLEELPSHGDGLHGEEEGEICGSNLGLTDVLATELGLRSFLAQTSSLWLKEDQIIVLFLLN